MNVFLTIRKMLFGNVARGFILYYLIFMIIGASLLMLPVSVAQGQQLDWVDAFFVSASGLSTTGLSTVDVSTVLSRFGQMVLVGIIQVGGVGLIMMVALFWLIIQKKITFSDRTMLMTDQNQLSRQGIVRFIRNVLIMIFAIEIIAIGIMTTYLYLAGYFPFGDALYHAFFTTISLFVNAGFDIAPDGASFAMYRQDFFMQSLAMTLMFFGAVGFWPLFEIKAWVQSKFTKKRFKFSIFTKVLLLMHFGIWIFSAMVFYVMELGHFLTDKSFVESIYYALFMSLTTRNAGFSTMSVTSLQDSTQAFFMFLMFIGSSPNSAGGGIRTTTILLIIAAVYSFAKGKKQVVIYQRSIKNETVFKSFVVFFIAITLIAFNTLILSITENANLQSIAFEVTSAFGTTGLSLGLSDVISPFGKFVLIFTMFIGRVGILVFLLMFKSQKESSSLASYPEIDMIVG